MGRRNHGQEQFFYSFRLDEAVPDDHLVRKIAAVLDLSWVHSELAPFYPKMGRPSIDPVLMIRMLIIGNAWRGHFSCWHISARSKDPEPIIAKISQETLADMIGTTRSRVNFFMNIFRQLGFVEYNGDMKVHSGLLNVVLHD